MTKNPRRGRRAPSLSVVEVCCAIAALPGPTTTRDLADRVATPAEGWAVDAVLDDMVTSGLVVRSPATLVTRWSLTPRGARVASLEESARRIAQSRNPTDAEEILREISREILTLIREPSNQGAQRA